MNKQKDNYTNYMQVMLMRLISKIEYLIVPKGTKFTGSGKLGLNHFPSQCLTGILVIWLS